MTKEDLGGIRKAAQWCQTHAASSDTVKQLVRDVLSLLTEVERLQQRCERSVDVTMHCPQCEARGRNLVDTIRQELGMAGACDPHSYIAVGTEIFGPVFTLNVGVSNEGCDGGGHNDE